MNAILRRRSIRKYTQDVISDNIIKKLLEAGMSAPSAGNQRPWHFVVIKGRETLVKLADASPYSKMTKDAPVAILVCGDLELEAHGGYWIQDCSAATQNILLAAHDQGLGAVWVGVYPTEDNVQGLKKLLNLPESIIPLSLRRKIGC